MPINFPVRIIKREAAELWEFGLVQDPRELEVVYDPKIDELAFTIGRSTTTVKEALKKLGDNRLDDFSETYLLPALYRLKEQRATV